MLTRRQALCLPFAAFALQSGGARGQQAVPITDMHTHYGLIERTLDTSGLADQMRAQRVAFIAWKAIPDARWLRATPSGVQPAGVPEPGALKAALTRQFDAIRSYIAAHKLVTLLTRSDVERCLTGEPGILLSSEGADSSKGTSPGSSRRSRRGFACCNWFTTSPRRWAIARPPPQPLEVSLPWARHWSRNRTSEASCWTWPT